MRADWSLSPDEILALPLDELALAVLRDFHAEDGWSEYNWMNAARQRYPQRPDTLQALAEAWGWLHARGLIAQGAVPNERAFVTRLGVRALEEGLREVRARERLQVDLHPRLTRIPRQFLLGEYDLAAFAAMREVEIAVRELGTFPERDIGVSLMKRAFRPEGGPLADPDLEKGEQEATMALLWGAIGVFKNPPSHRQVEFDDPTLASEVILLADLLLRLLDHVAASKSKP